METTVTSATRNTGSISCQNSQGFEIHATTLRLSRHSVVFELYAASVQLQLSEVLNDFRVLADDRPLYFGRAIVSNLINVGSVTVCEARLEEGWIDVEDLNQGSPGLKLGFNEFLRGWEKVGRVETAFKSVVADIQTFLSELQIWTEQLELAIRSAPSGSRAEAERKAVKDLFAPLTSCLNPLFAKFEELANGADETLLPLYGIYAKRQLHPLLLCAPFMYRIFRKPLGYAGDYEMVNMILRDPHEGSNLFAKLLNTWFLGQKPAQAHRNRVEYLTGKLLEESLRVGGGKALRVYNLGCGPAQEVAAFISKHELAGRADFTLLDFNEETLAWTSATLEEAKRSHSRQTRVQLVRKSVGQVIKASVRQGGGAADQGYQVAYCAGLFDYLPDRVCRQLTTTLYDLLAPGGLMIVTNVDRSNPIRRIMDLVFEWHLIYRNRLELEKLVPDRARPEDCTIQADLTGTNIFLEVRKPLHPS